MGRPPGRPPKNRTEPPPPPPPSSFFKVMFGDFKRFLRVPPSFAKLLAGRGRKFVLRTSRDGRAWDVETATETGGGGGYLIGGGWSSFLESHAVSIGDFLVFFYDGKESFDVLIYGRSGCEKETSPPPRPRESLARAVAKKRGRKPGSFVFGATSRGRLISSRWLSKAVDRESAALRDALAFKPSNPYFVAAFAPSFVGIPKEFLSELDLEGLKPIVLKGPTGACWLVKLCVCEGGRVIVSAGWSAFAKGNCLREGDVCLFELGRGSNNMFHVHIFRGVNSSARSRVGSGEKPDRNRLRITAGGSMPSEEIDDKRKVQPIETHGKKMKVQDNVIATAFVNGRSQFVATWRSSFKYNLRIPGSVGRELGLFEKESLIIRDSSGRSWPSKMYSDSTGCLRLSLGWSMFQQTNCLQEGDACALEFVPGSDILYVDIIRGEEANAELVNFVISTREREQRKFVSTWESSSSPYAMRVPVGFSRAHSLCSKDKVVIKDPNGRSWPVGLYLRPNEGADLGPGWVHFVRANGLVSGDMCVFEFVAGDAIQVFISRTPEPL